MMPDMGTEGTLLFLSRRFRGSRSWRLTLRGGLRLEARPELLLGNLLHSAS